VGTPEAARLARRPHKRHPNTPQTCHHPTIPLSHYPVASGPDPADAATKDPLFQSRIAPATPFAEQARPGAGRRMLGLFLALAIEALMLFLLFTMGPGRPPGVEEDRTTMVTFIAPEAAEKAPEPSPEPEPNAAEQPATQPRDAEQPRPPLPAEPAETPQPIMPMRYELPPAAAIPPRASRPAPPAGPAYGPADTRSAASRDTERVGTAPNGEPLYAASWYTEPRQDAMRAYLSTAHGPGWGLIACRTAPDYRVEDCVALEEWPQGSQINRAVLAMAWEFRVRPPRLGGRSLVGAWVRIRIDWDIRRRRTDY
jgi:periplasmic protein TonB